MNFECHFLGGCKLFNKDDACMIHFVAWSVIQFFLYELS